MKNTTLRRLALAATQFAFVSLAAAFGCKPPADSAVFEAGGALASWRVKTLLTNSGQITIERTGDGDLFSTPITGVSIEIASAPDNNSAGRLDNFPERTFMPLRVNGADDLRFNVLLTVGTNLCYTNNVKLDDSINPVNCKTNNEVTGERNERIRAQLQRRCETLSRQSIPGVESTFYTLYDVTTSRDQCRCLNGQNRDVLYRTYFDSDDADSDFTVECQRNPLTDSTTANRDMCTRLISLNTRITMGGDYCQCGDGGRVRFADYVNRTPDFRRDCEAMTAGTFTGTHTGTGTATATGTGTNTATEINVGTNTGSNTATGTDGCITQPNPETGVPECVPGDQTRDPNAP